MRKKTSILLSWLNKHLVPTHVTWDWSWRFLFCGDERRWYYTNEQTLWQVKESGVEILNSLLEWKLVQFEGSKIKSATPFAFSLWHFSQAEFHLQFKIDLVFQKLPRRKCWASFSASSHLWTMNENICLPVKLDLISQTRTSWSEGRHIQNNIWQSIKNTPSPYLAYVIGILPLPSLLMGVAQIAF